MKDTAQLTADYYALRDVAAANASMLDEDSDTRMAIESTLAALSAFEQAMLIRHEWVSQILVQLAQDVADMKAGSPANQEKNDE